MWPRKRDQRAEEFGRYWDALASAATPEEIARLREGADTNLVAATERLRSIHRNPEVDPAFVARLERDLMQKAFALAHGHGATRLRGEDQPGSKPPRSTGLHDQWASRSSWLSARLGAAAVVIITVVGMLWFSGGLGPFGLNGVLKKESGGSASPTAVVATPTPIGSETADGIPEIAQSWIDAMQSEDPGALRALYAPFPDGTYQDDGRQLILMTNDLVKLRQFWFASISNLKIEPKFTAQSDLYQLLECDVSYTDDATGKTVAYGMAVVFRINQGKIVRSTMYYSLPAN